MTTLPEIQKLIGEIELSRLSLENRIQNTLDWLNNKHAPTEESSVADNAEPTPILDNIYFSLNREHNELNRLEDLFLSLSSLLRGNYIEAGTASGNKLSAAVKAFKNG